MCSARQFAEGPSGGVGRHRTGSNPHATAGVFHRLPRTLLPRISARPTATRTWYTPSLILPLQSSPPVAATWARIVALAFSLSPGRHETKHDQGQSKERRKRLLLTLRLLQSMNNFNHNGSRSSFRASTRSARAGLTWQGPHTHTHLADFMVEAVEADMVCWLVYNLRYGDDKARDLAFRALGPTNSAEFTLSSQGALPRKWTPTQTMLRDWSSSCFSFT
jgi:hypothetical protein